MTTSTVAPEIVAFARGVRDALADLSAEEVDDLTDGLEADLAESLAEDLRRTLPDPVAYAAELRSAAGLPGRQASGRGGLGDTWAGARTVVVGAIDRNPSLATLVDFLVALRPAWWIVRAWVATWLLAAFFGMEDGWWFEGAWWLVLVGLVVVSVQWGRDRWPVPGLKGLLVVGNVIAVLALLPVLSSAQARGGDDDYGAGYEDGAGAVTETQGLSMDGRPLENVYAYDSAGNKLSGVQLFDVDGTPLVPNRAAEETQVVQTPVTLETGASALNVYPLAITRMIFDDLGSLVPDPSPDPDKVAAYANGPFIKVPAVLAAPAPAPETVATPNQ